VGSGHVLRIWFHSVQSPVPEGVAQAFGDPKEVSGVFDLSRRDRTDKAQERERSRIHGVRLTISGRLFLSAQHS
jgi:hypothetical protein